MNQTGGESGGGASGRPACRSFGVGRRWGLACVLAAGALLRLWGLSDRGLAHYDEGHLARFLTGPVTAARWAVRSVVRQEPLSSASLKREFERSGFPYPYLAAKHGYAAFVAAGMAVAGLKDWVPLAVSATFGIGTILLVFRVGSFLGGTWAGFSAAGILAVSPNHLFFSRSAFAHASSAFFLAWGLLAYLRSLNKSGSSRNLCWAGLLAGIAFLCHYNLVWFPFLLGICEIGWGLSGGGAKGALAGARRWLGFAGLFLVPVLACELATRLAQLAFGAWIPGVHSYWSEMCYSSVGLMGTIFEPARTTPWFNVIHIVRTEGLLYAVLLTAGLAFALRSGWRGKTAREKGTLLIGCSIAFLLALYTVPSFKTSRTLLVVFVLGAILVGILCAWILRRRIGGAIALLLVSMHLILVGPLDLRLIRGRSPYPGLAEEAKRRGRWLVAVDDYPVVDFYQPGGEIFVRDEATFRRIRAAHPEPLTLLVVNRGGERGFDDPMWIKEGRYAFVQRVVAARSGPDRTTDFRLPLDFEYMDREFRWDRLFSLSVLPYRVEAYDLDDVE